jgi:hypothetical protein
VVFYLQLLLFTGLIFLLLGWLKRPLTITLDGSTFARSLDRSADVAWKCFVNATALALAGSSERSGDIMGARAFWLAPGSPGAWRSGQPLC